MDYQKTVSRVVQFSGVGLHTGKPVKLAIKPAKSDTGILINSIPANWKNVSGTNRATTVSGITTVEHLLAALYAYGIDNADIEVEGPEFPIMDGSASAFSILQDLTRRLTGVRKYLKIKENVLVSESNRYIKVIPCDTFAITATVYWHQIGNQTHSIRVNAISFDKDIARARTFGFSKDIKEMQKKKLIKGASTNNAILLNAFGQPSSPFRMENELVKHKILDIIGDISLVGYPILGHIQSYSPGHSLNYELIKRIFDKPNNYEIVN